MTNIDIHTSLLKSIINVSVVQAYDGYRMFFLKLNFIEGVSGITLKGRRDTQDDDIQHNDTQHNSE